MAEGAVTLRPDDFKTHTGVEELNRMLRFLYENVVGDGDGVRWFSGYGSPEGVITAKVGSMYSRLDGSAGSVFYMKNSGSASTGWGALS